MALIKCRECGKDISDESKKCIHCGAPVIKTIECSECHKTYDLTTNTCPYCGKKNSSDLGIDVQTAKKNLKAGVKKHKVKFIVIGAVVLLLAIVGIVCAKVIPPLLVTVEEYLEQGDYEKALEKAHDEDEEEAVIIENFIARTSYEISDMLKDPDSFKLQHVYFDYDHEMVFEVVGKNSYGGNVTAYYDYRYSKDDKKYTLFVHLSSLEAESYSYYDNSTERLEKAIKNVVRETVKKMMNDKDKKIDDDVVDRVNKLFKKGQLRNVELLDEVTTLYPKDSGSDDDKV